MRKCKNVNLNDYDITKCFSNDNDIVEYFKGKNICYNTFIKRWQEKTGYSLKQSKMIWLYDTIERLKTA